MFDIDFCRLHIQFKDASFHARCKTTSIYYLLYILHKNYYVFSIALLQKALKSENLLKILIINIIPLLL